MAAASNLIQVLPQIAAAFERQDNVRVVASYGSTAQLARQVENGAPLDVFLAASHIPAPGRVIYTQGRLIAWSPMNSIHDLASAEIRSIAIAKPELAPYGAAAVIALHRAGLWDKLEKKIVYAPSISAAKQLADTGNVDVAITAMSLTEGQKGNSFAIDPSLYPPVEQAACVTSQAEDKAEAKRFIEFLRSPGVQAVFRRHGYN